MLNDPQLRVLPLDGLVALIARLSRTVADLAHARGETGVLIATSYRNALAGANDELARRAAHARIK